MLGQLRGHDRLVDLRAHEVQDPGRDEDDADGARAEEALAESGAGLLAHRSSLRSIALRTVDRALPDASTSRSAHSSEVLSVAASSMSSFADCPEVSAGTRLRVADGRPSPGASARSSRGRACGGASCCRAAAERPWRPRPAPLRRRRRRRRRRSSRHHRSGGRARCGVPAPARGRGSRGCSSAPRRRGASCGAQHRVFEHGLHAVGGEHERTLERVTHIAKASRNCSSLGVRRGVTEPVCPSGGRNTGAGAPSRAATCAIAHAGAADRRVR